MRSIRYGASSISSINRIVSRFILKYGVPQSADNKEIATFCKENFGVTFPLMQKSDVRGINTNDIFKWLNNPKLNGWNSQKPKWNFTKYLISEQGELLAYFASSVSPLEDIIVNKILN